MCGVVWGCAKKQSTFPFPAVRTAEAVPTGEGCNRLGASLPGVVQSASRNAGRGTWFRRQAALRDHRSQATCLPAAGRSPGGARSPSPRRWALPRLLQDSRPQGEKHLPPTQPSALLTRAAGASEARGPRGSGGRAGSAGFWPGVFRRRWAGNTGGKRRRFLSYRFRSRETGPESPGATPGLGGGHRPRSLSRGPCVAAMPDPTQASA